MSLGYTIAYRIGFTPWERAGRGGAIIADEAADTSGMPGPLKNAAPRWYRLSLAGGAPS